MATLTLTTSGAQDARIAAAFGRALTLVDAQGVLRNATAAEIKAAIIDHVRATVLAQETVVASTAATAAVADIGTIT